EVERVQGRKWQKPHVIFRVESIRHLAQNSMKIPGIAMLADENHNLGQRKLSRTKQRHRRLEQFFRMTFLCGYNEQIMKTRTGIRTITHDIGIDELDKGPDHFSRRNTQKLVFLRRLAHDRPGIDRVSPMSDFANVEDGKLCRVRVMSEVISER